jgi:hypothetical protein
LSVLFYLIDSHGSIAVHNITICSTDPVGTRGMAEASDAHGLGDFMKIHSRGVAT